MMLLLIVRSTEETLKMLPGSLKEAGLALGASYTSVILKVLLPAAFGGLFTGILLAISRVMGETAPLMLTALGSTAINWDVLKPTSAVPLLIWEFYNDPEPDRHDLEFLPLPVNVNSDPQYYSKTNCKKNGEFNNCKF